MPRKPSEATIPYTFAGMREAIVLELQRRNIRSYNDADLDDFLNEKFDGMLKARSRAARRENVQRTHVMQGAVIDWTRQFLASVGLESLC